MDDSKSGTSRRLRLAGGVCLLLAVLVAELALSARQQSQTFDEACHIFAGYQYWKHFDFGINPEHPPLVKLVAALPLLHLPLKMSPVPDGFFVFVEFLGGRQFLYANDAGALLWKSRLAAASFTVGLALVVFLMAFEMWGTVPAFLALILLIFEPNLLAHGALVTTDMGLTFGFFLAVSGFYLYVKRPSVIRLIAVGLAVGICLAAKHSGILILPTLACLAAAEILCGSKFEASSSWLRKEILPRLGSLAIIFVIALVTLWSFYGFRYSARPAGMSITPPLAAFSVPMGPSGSTVVLQMAHWRLLPEAYLYGLADIFGLTRQAPTYLFGKFYSTGQWFYFPAVFVIKSTLPFLMLLLLIPLTKALRDKQWRRQVLFLSIPPAIYFCFALGSGINIGVRHILPVYPFLMVLVAFCAWNLAQRQRAYAVVLTLLISWHAVSSLRAFPNYLAYANEAWGGPENTHRILADSNVDWGQGLIAMKHYIDEHQIKNCWFAYFGSMVANPAYYGIPCKALPSSFATAGQFPMEPIPSSIDGPVFISASEVSGTLWDSDSANPYLQFRSMPTAALIADSILVFNGPLDISAAAALTHENASMRLVRFGQLDQALAEAQTAVTTAPNRPGAHAALANVLSKMNRESEAQAELQKAQQLEQVFRAGG
jgi:4-amino-4-deoxy-L-arabinose transferase-like glycosyltransferase